MSYRMTHTTKHTPGPWQVNDSTENDDDTTLTIFAPADEVEIATMSAYENGCECFSEIRENAHLIAAAPAMYLALQNIVEGLTDEITRIIEGNEPDTAWLDYLANKAGQALSQAEGRHHE